jgi:hypothetical protein
MPFKRVPISLWHANIVFAHGYRRFLPGYGRHQNVAKVGEMATVDTWLYPGPLPITYRIRI